MRNDNGVYTSIPIQLMNDLHLKNVVDVWINKLKEAKKMISTASVKNDINFISMRVNPQEIARRAEEQILKANEVLPYYLYECLIRGIKETSLGDITKNLQQIFERTEEVKQVTELQRLSYYEDDEDDEEYIDPNF